MILHEKLRKLLSGDDVKEVQKIVLAIGHICVKETSSSLLNIALELIFSLSRSKVGTTFFFFISYCACILIFFFDKSEKFIKKRRGARP
jgi:hypothetical protein